MNVALYAYRLAYPHPTGVNRYVTELSKALHARYPQEYRLLASPEKVPAPWVPGDLPLARVPGRRRPLHLAWTLTHRPRIDRFVPGAELLHVLVPTWPVPSRIPVVYTMHDLTPMQFPDWYPAIESFLFRAAARDVVGRARRIIAVSRTVADSLTERLQIDPTRITVVHEGIDERFRTPPPAEISAQVCARYGVEPGRYLVHVGWVTTRKNLTVLVEALARRGKGAPLLFVGPEGFGAGVVKDAIEHHGVRDRVTFTGHVPDEDLPALMASALALVHPSRYEGFGFTPLEAMALGTPAIAARAGALPEVLGDAAVLLDPDDADAWADAMKRIEEDPIYAQEHAETGRRHALTFTWDKAAVETHAVHRAALGL
ncbi:MAG TPA: glycosyltransferase family 1 protein [Actinomycetota bacterium]|nr:glycosyltransferase family 1 protein [Actinomycetota bacterium]